VAGQGLARSCWSARREGRLGLVLAPRRGPNAHYLWIDQNTLTLDGGTLRGENRRTHGQTVGPDAEVGATLSPSIAEIQNQAVAGTYARSSPASRFRGKSRGRSSPSSQLRTQNAIQRARTAGLLRRSASASAARTAARRCSRPERAAPPCGRPKKPRPACGGRGPTAATSTGPAVVGCDGGRVQSGGRRWTGYLYYFRPTGPNRPGLVDEAPAKPWSSRSAKLAAKERSPAPSARRHARLAPHLRR